MYFVKLTLYIYFVNFRINYTGILNFTMQSKKTQCCDLEINLFELDLL